MNGLKEKNINFKNNNMYDTINDYMENPNMDTKQLNDLLIMAEEFKNQLDPLFSEYFKTNVESDTINDLPF
jgi:hypothetical protein